MTEDEAPTETPKADAVTPGTSELTTTIVFTAEAEVIPGGAP